MIPQHSGMRGVADAAPGLAQRNDIKAQVSVWEIACRARALDDVQDEDVLGLEQQKCTFRLPQRTWQTPGGQGAAGSPRCGTTVAPLVQVS
jgi:hypothetical protein